MNVVRRCPLGPDRATQLLELRNLEIEAWPRSPGGDDCELDGDADPEPPEDDPPDDEPVAATPADGSAVDGRGEPALAVAADGEGTAGADGAGGSDGAGRGGAGKGGTGTGKVGTAIGGAGTTSASATRAPRHAAAAPTINAASLTHLRTSITQITPFGRFRLRAKWEFVAAAKVNYYEVLGVPPHADGETIREAFHAAARDAHPDVSDDPAAESYFRDLAEAYSVLSKPASRLLYDRYGYRGRGNTGFEEALWDAWERGSRGKNIHAPVRLSHKEALAGGFRLVRYEAARECRTCGGRGTTGDVDPDCPACGGTGRRSRVYDNGTERFLRVEPCPMCGGEVCTSCRGSGTEAGERSLKVRMPEGIDSGTLLRVDGEGGVGDRGGLPGDLLLDVVVLPETQDSRLVRYVALGLCLAAIALLLAYVLFQ